MAHPGLIKELCRPVVEEGDALAEARREPGLIGREAPPRSAPAARRSMMRDPIESSCSRNQRPLGMLEAAGSRCCKWDDVGE